jgi:hypothetical protein
MKKILVTILLAFFGVINVNAQEIDSLQIKSDTISIETLVARLDKLQLNYDFLNCRHQLSADQYDLAIFANKLDIKSNGLLINCYHSRYNVDLYISYRENYNKSVEMFNALKDKVTSTKTLIALHILTSNFTEEELGVLRSGCASLDSTLNIVQGALDYYKLVIDIYKEME